MKFKTYNNETLYDCDVSYKIDGVRAHLINNQVVSRNGKPLYNVPKIYSVCEVFLGDWNKTVSAVRTKSKVEIPIECLYSLDPIDSRLIIGYFKELTPDAVSTIMLNAVSNGYEGLIIKTKDSRYKVKPIETFDLLVRGVTSGTGKYVGKVGALITDMGKVGTGLSDKDRETDFIGKIIEVSATSVTKNGKLRHPRFIRIREDK